MRPRRFMQVDVFTDRPFAGNPVAVVLDAAGLDTAAMQAIARWTNLSETTFVLPADAPGADYRLRIFTPGAELPFAGHPTLGSAWAVRSSGTIAGDRERMIQQCGAGLVTVRVDGPRLWLRLPPQRHRALDAGQNRRLAQTLGLPSTLQARAIDVGPVWQPDLPALARLSDELQVTGAVVFGHRHDGGDGPGYEVRAFAPAHGVPEDPVCGSGNGCVASLLAAGGRGTDYVARQGRAIGRDGFVQVHFDGADIEIGGHCVTVVEGAIRA
ncbi:MAG TPA: PhzF family phenazine biosynthesis protein [Burkholderiaceae bacterium]|nr:PhzF family phenazine biosynthesis protein [Burkholderiaceae bacterium]